MNMVNWIYPNKIIAADVETSGVGPEFGLQQVAMIMYIDSKKVDSLNIQIKIFKTDKIDKKALEVTGLDPTKGLEPEEGYRQIVAFLDKYISKFDKTDKAYFLAMNANFDIDALVTFFKKNDNPYFGSYTNFNLIDPLPFFRMARYLKLIDTKDMKLKTLCEYFGIELDNAHDAMSDVTATVKLAGIVMQEMKKFDISKYRKV